MDIREIDGLWCDDITFCPERCGWESCPRNSKNIRDRRVPHSFSVEIPQDCPKKQERAVKTMPDRENTIDGLIMLRRFLPSTMWEPINDAIELLKEQKVQEELKLKIWNSLYTKEDEYEKKLIEADKCHEWFSIYRPWLQMGFNIAIDAIAEWEGR